MSFSYHSFLPSSFLLQGMDFWKKNTAWGDEQIPSAQVGDDKSLWESFAWVNMSRFYLLTRKSSHKFENFP